jgi:hypothetical protein
MRYTWAVDTGRLFERYLDDSRAAGRIACDPRLVPAPGQYLLAHALASDSPLPVPVFSGGAAAGGFLAAPPLPAAWTPGTSLLLRGPFGRGFSLPASARRVALAALDSSPSCLLGLIPPALTQGASVVLVCDSPPADLPLSVEIQPRISLVDILAWADYLAIDVARDSAGDLRDMLGRNPKHPNAGQALVHAPMPCGGIAECGVCAVQVSRGWKMACRDGPVFDLDELK